MLPSPFHKWYLCISLSFVLVLEVGTHNLKAILNAFQEAGTLPLRSVCCHFMHVPRRIDAETHLVQATGLVAVSSGLLTVTVLKQPAGLLLLGSACKDSVYRHKPAAR